MEKLVYLVWERPSTDGGAWGARVLEEAVPAILAAGVRGLEVHVDDDRATLPSLVPVPDDELPVRAAISVWLDDHERRARVEHVLAGLGVRRAGYLVTESIPDDYGDTESWPTPRDWPDGERSPGIVLLTTFRRPVDLDPATFRAHWYRHQTPMSSAMQPRARYVRNTVVHGVTPGAPPLDAVVAEAWPSEEHVSDLRRFFGVRSDDAIAENVRVMLDSMKVLAAPDSLRTVTMSEYLVRSAW